MTELEKISEKLDLIINSNQYVPYKGMITVDHFSQCMDIPKKTVMEWIYDKSEQFPAYKLGRHWYVDMKKWPAWRDSKHVRCYKYA